MFDGDLANPRVYDPSGALVTPPVVPRASGDAASAAGGGYVMTDRDRPLRQRDLIRRFGAPVGTLAGRDRYLSHEDDTMTELLVEPSTMLPAEISVVRKGALDRRIGIGYGRMPGGRWYVATVRSELVLAGGSGRRFVSTSTHLNVAAPEVR